jgi:DNA helicase II / ATP-dependent DNA helicase PcrA
VAKFKAVQSFLEQLNEVQRQAVTSVEGPSLVIAGAGSGKTRVLTYRIAYLLSQGVNARSVLALTFTNKAAKEMKERIAALVGDNVARNLWMGTFHSIFARILRQEAELIAFPSSFTIYDTQDSKSAVKGIIKELNLDDQVYKVNDVFGRISMAKNNLTTPAAYLSSAAIQEQDRASRKPRIGDIYKLYVQKCKKAGAMDFDDLLLYTNILFRDFPEALKKYQRLFNFILVDEYQDTNYAQYLIVKRLAEGHRNVCVVGDDAQSIYSFRGAKIENILNFKNDYKEFKLFKLEQNYRSTQTIVDAANSVIRKNRGQIKKDVFSENEKGNLIPVIQSQNDHEEGFQIAANITILKKEEECEWNDFAVLYRTNSQSRIFEEAFRKRSIPYKVFGSLSFYQRKEIKDLLSYFRMIVNPLDDEAFKRIINYPARGIGNTTLERLEAQASATGKSFWEVITGIMPDSINRPTQQKIIAFANFIQSLQTRLYTENAYDLAYSIANQSGIVNDLKSENTIENISKLENVEELLNSIKDFSDIQRETGQPDSLMQYLENVALLTDADNEKEEDKNKVTMMTIHSAKGLEFRYVFIVGLEEDLFPNKMTASSPQDLEEERRLFYVALTRAEKRVILSYALSRYKWGQPTDCSASRFINDIDSKYIDIPEPEEENVFPRQMLSRKPLPGNNLEENHTSSPVNRKLTKINTAINRKIVPSASSPTAIFEASDAESIQVGQNVIHQRFGKGEVIAVEGNMGDRKATVRFEFEGDKQLLLKFARLKIVE